MIDLEDIYTEKVLQLAANMPRAGRLAKPQVTASAQAKLCGSKITLDIVMENGVVSDYAQDVRACLLGQTSAAVVGAQIIGTTPEEVREIAAQMRQMLHHEGPSPSGRWSDLAVLELVRDYKARHGSVMLVFDALENAFDQIETKHSVEAQR